MHEEKLTTEKVYVTTYALTKGILVYPNGGTIVGGTYFQSGSPTHSCSDPTYCFVGPTQWTTDPAVARARWEKAWEKKVASLKKQLKALANLEPSYLTVQT